MDVTVATELIRSLFGMDHEALEKAVRNSSPGANGLMLLPFFHGERTPNLPEAKGVLLGLGASNMNKDDLCRAFMEGATLGLGYVLERMKSLGIKPEEIRLTGGGSKSSIWRSICASVFGVPVVRCREEEGAALGAAVQAYWTHEGGRKEALKDLVDSVVKMDPGTYAEPEDRAMRNYSRLGTVFEEAVKALEGLFPKI